MKSYIFFISALILASVSVASELSPIEKKQRKVVSRFYEVLEMMPSRCPESKRSEYSSSVVKFENMYPKFKSALRDSKFRPYAIENFSNASAVTEGGCLYIKDALDRYTNTDKGKQKMLELLSVMAS
ncbi:hypothetical protein [Teredinibacter sp. KSP-S5-2]|uniref:hypothetical protein n=1 Tax=Teredinibacter sp. KSP-S5-2 TaxID=3034506 RepID=UPI002934305C|nr:hypothetical protein [Teredinibacter sp. KSP-S5-2]WNO09982.1 hypothetical protein P5V12_02235 [Teredinibacter sp. KSP-S5-2]